MIDLKFCVVVDSRLDIMRKVGPPLLTYVYCGWKLKFPLMFFGQRLVIYGGSMFFFLFFFKLLLQAFLLPGIYGYLMVDLRLYFVPSGNLLAFLICSSFFFFFFLIYSIVMCATPIAFGWNALGWKLRFWNSCSINL